MHSLPRLLTLLAILPGFALAAASWRVTVMAADTDRAAVVVSFPLPAGAPRDAALTGSGGALPVQVGADGTARFVVPRIKAGESPVFLLAAAPARPAAVRAEQTATQVKLSAGGQPVLDCWTAVEPLPNDKVDRKYLRSGHLHPVRTPAGTAITASYPSNHLHHHGIWAPWTKTRFQGREPDFWNMGQLTGKVEFAALDRTWSGPVHGGFTARQRQIDLSAPSPVTALDEIWEVTVYEVPGAAQPMHVFDLVITQNCATPDPLLLPEYHYGGLGFRGHDQWNGADQAFFLTSEGETDRVKGNTSRARWVHIGGRIDGALAGIGILGHPENFRAPQPLRLHPHEPFVCFAPSQLGEWRIEPGRPYVARYRFIVADGAPDRALLEACWQGYARPATATVEAD
ncbi:MAG: PmoA family protein [Verrucomicrobiota bacterium]